jgi:hypothetical protein
MRTLLLGLVCAMLITGGAATAQTTATNNPLTNEEIDALRAAVSKTWKAAGYKSIVTVRVRLNPDGTLAAPPKVVSTPDGPNLCRRRGERDKSNPAKPALPHAQAGLV